MPSKSRIPPSIERLINECRTLSENKNEEKEKLFIRLLKDLNSGDHSNKHLRETITRIIKECDVSLSKLHLGIGSTTLRRFMIYHDELSPDTKRRMFKFIKLMIQSAKCTKFAKTMTHKKLCI